MVQKISESVNLHPLVIEDILNVDQRAKMEEFDGYIYLVLKMFHLKQNDEIVPEQVSIILSKNYVVTFQEGIEGSSSGCLGIKWLKCLWACLPAAVCTTLHEACLFIPGQDGTLKRPCCAWFWQAIEGRIECRQSVVLLFFYKHGEGGIAQHMLRCAITKMLPTLVATIAMVLYQTEELQVSGELLSVWGGGELDNWRTNAPKLINNLLGCIYTVAQMTG